MKKINWIEHVIFALYFSFGYWLITFLAVEAQVRIYCLNTTYIPKVTINLMVIGFASLIFFGLLFIPLILLKREKIHLALANFLLGLFLFLSPMIISSFVFKLEYFYLVDGFTYGFLLSLISGLRFTDISYDFLTRLDLSENVKIFKLKIIYDKWFRGLLLFTPFILMGVIGVAINWILSSPVDKQKDIATILAFKLSYLGPGIGWGVYWNIIKKVNQVDEKIENLSKNSISKMNEDETPTDDHKLSTRLRSCRQHLPIRNIRK